MLDLARNGRAHARSAEPAPPAAPDIMELCFAANVVCTPAMYAVLRAVVDAGNLPTACEIHRHAATRRPSLTLGSTYRLLTKLVGAGVLTYHGLGDGMARYGVQETRHSGHLIDVDDGRIEEISNEELVSQLSRWQRSSASSWCVFAWSFTASCDQGSEKLPEREKARSGAA